MSIPAILQDADRALSEALSDDPAQRLEAMTRFMRSFYDIAKEVHARNGSWDDVRPWAREVADRVWAAHTALGD